MDVYRGEFRLYINETQILFVIFFINFIVEFSFNSAATVHLESYNSINFENTLYHRIVADFHKLPFQYVSSILTKQ